MVPGGIWNGGESLKTGATRASLVGVVLGGKAHGTSAPMHYYLINTCSQFQTLRRRLIVFVVCRVRQDSGCGTCQMITFA